MKLLKSLAFKFRKTAIWVIWLLAIQAQSGATSLAALCKLQSNPSPDKHPVNIRSNQAQGFLGLGSFPAAKGKDPKKERVNMY